MTGRVQCYRCGRVDSFRNFRHDAVCEWCLKHVRLPKKEKNRKKARAKAKARRTDYHAYIHSPAWGRKRQRKFGQVGRRCEKCGRDSDLQVHHLTYVRLGRERMGDLQVLCRGCHEGVHEIAIQARRHLDSIGRE